MPVPGGEIGEVELREGQQAGESIGQYTAQ